jgi:hypothetical protein
MELTEPDPPTRGRWITREELLHRLRRIQADPGLRSELAEYAYLQNTALQDQIEDNRAHPERRRPRPVAKDITRTTGIQQG